ncbi:hypothetical protein ZEAMMB73_Zm00001d016589 [Zea mays]|uniref:Uncharacterized protein n=1 Tax=Zea mays TaxID=4577 RepID=A0A1D6H928_MAIZE|nr:hypothetical protein ZEAMMB73_Zm00001d016589 [Zea mays]
MKAETQKGTIFASVNFDDDDNVFDEEAEKARVAHLNESTINAIIGGRVSKHLEDSVTIGDIFVESCAQKEGTINVDKIEEVIDEPYT